MSSKKRSKTKKKFITSNLNYRLLKEGSPKEKYYRNAFYCNEILYQQGKTVTGRYCNSRTCLICNGIRVATYINAYGSQVMNLKEPQFVTLTAVTVKCLTPDELEGVVKHREGIWRKITDLARKQKVSLKGVKVMEVTSSKGETYNPHFHLVIEGKDTAEWVVEKWITYNNKDPGIAITNNGDGNKPTALEECQRIQPLKDQNGLLEVFKYCTKFIVDKDDLSGGKKLVNTRKLDIIIRALSGKRRVPESNLNQVTYGTRYEDLDEVISRLWRWNKEDWYANDTGEPFSDKPISDKLREIVKNDP